MDLFGFDGNIRAYDTPKVLWKVIEIYRIKKNWSENDVKYWVGRIKEFENISIKWQNIFLPLDKVVDLFLKTKDFSARTAIKLKTNAEDIEILLKDNPLELNNFYEWLKNGVEDYSWDIRQLIRYKRLLLSKDNNIESRWLYGDWRKHINTLDDESGHLLLIDPPYGINYHSDRKSDRRNDRKHEKIKNDGIAETIVELQTSLPIFYNKLVKDAHLLCFCHWSNECYIKEIIMEAGYNIRGSLIWIKNNIGMGDPYTTFAPKHERIIHAVKGSPILFRRDSDVSFSKKIPTKNHPTEKPISLLSEYIEVTTVEKELVIDMYGGVASTPIAAKLLQRKYWGCELVKKYYDAGKKRLNDCNKQTTFLK